MDPSPINAKRFQKRSLEIAHLMKAFGHPARLMLAVTLYQKEHSVGELEEKLGVHQPSLSQQLGVLRLAGIVETRRESKQIFYRLTDEKAALLIEALDAIYAKK
ncbi:MAG: metalloregulator ArsR/SmtB family transcription factor [Mesorhizobium sp.]